MIVGRIYKLRKDMKLRLNESEGQEICYVRNKALVTILSVDLLSRIDADEYNKYYKISILFDDKVGWFRAITAVRFRKSFFLVENEEF